MFLDLALDFVFEGAVEEARAVDLAHRGEVDGVVQARLDEEALHGFDDFEVADRWGPVLVPEAMADAAVEVDVEVVDGPPEADVGGARGVVGGHVQAEDPDAVAVEEGAFGVAVDDDLPDGDVFFADGDAVELVAGFLQGAELGAEAHVAVVGSGGWAGLSDVEEGSVGGARSIVVYQSLDRQDETLFGSNERVKGTKGVFVRCRSDGFELACFSSV